MPLQRGSPGTSLVRVSERRPTPADARDVTAVRVWRLALLLAGLLVALAAAALLRPVLATAAFERDGPAIAPPVSRAVVAAPDLDRHPTTPVIARPERAPAPLAKPDVSLAAQVRAGGSVSVRAAPGGGPVVARLGDRTEFGSPQTLAVVARRGHWLGVITAALPNGKIGWIDLRQGAVRLDRTDLSVEIDLSRRLLVVRRGDEVIRRARVGIGRDGSPTPVGRFAVTDKLPGGRYGAYYGCCIIALSAHQPNLPRGWTGGDRVAIHGTNDPASIGARASAGCLHGREADLRFLMRRLPLGTPVVIRA